MNRKNLLLLGLLLSAFGLQAQTTPTTELRLSLEEAQAYALKHNYTMQNASLDVQKAEANRWQTLATMLPQVKGTFDYSSMCGYQMNVGAYSIPMNPNGTLGLSASVAVTGAQVVGTLINDIAIEMSDITRRQTEQTIRANVSGIYASILVMEETLGLLDSSLSNMQRLHQTTQTSVDAGAAEQIAADKFSVQVASLRNTINANHRALQVLYNSLILALGAPVDAHIVLTTTTRDFIDIDEAAKLTTQAFHIEDNYDYQLLKQNEAMSKKQVTLTWMDYVPTLTAYYQYSYKTYFGKDAGMNMTPPNMIGASLSVPIFGSGTRHAKLKAAKISYQETLNSTRQAEDGLRVQYNQLCYNLVSAVETYKILHDNIEVIRRVFANTTNKFEHGYASQLEVTTASSDLITAQSDYIQAFLSAVNAYVSLRELMGME